MKQNHTLENFSGRSPCCVRQDFFAAELLKNITQLFLLSQQTEIEQKNATSKHRYQGNYCQALSRLRGQFFRLVVRPCVAHLTSLLSLMAQSVSVIRDGQRYSRKRKRSATHGCEGYKPSR